MNIISKILKYLKKHTKTINKILLVIVVGAFVASIATLIHYRALYLEQDDVRSELTSQVESASDVNAELNATIQEKDKQLDSCRAEIEALEVKIATLNEKVKALEADNAELVKEVANFTTYPDKEYRQSTYVWTYLKSLGLNDYVCAGILGNIMAEVGGQTLDISKYSMVESNNYFGMCQWAGSRKERLLRDFGTTIEAQCRFLGVELFEVIPKDNSFYSMQDEQEAALYFAQKYERCGSGSYSVRQKNATKALKYFTGK